MTYLRFDTNQGRDTVARLRQVVENMRSESETTHSNIDSLVDSGWIAPAAYEFQNTASELRQLFNSTLERLAELSARLDAEITEWEETAATFGSYSFGIVGGATGIAGGQMFFEPAARMPEQPSFEPVPQEAAKDAVSSGNSAEKVSANTSAIAVGAVSVNHDADASDCVRFVKGQGRSVPAGNPATWIPTEIPKDGVYKGFYVGTQPRPGAIMAEASNPHAGIGGTGHTSFVEQVNKDGTYRVVEGNWSGGKHEATFQSDGTSGKRRTGIFIYGPVESGLKK